MGNRHATLERALSRAYSKGNSRSTTRRAQSLGQRSLQKSGGGGTPSRPTSSSTKAQALVKVAQFKAASGTTPWDLVRSSVADRLKDLVNDPDIISQGSLNLCGPAAFFNVWLQRDPLAVVTYAAELFEKGKSTIGSLSVKAGSDLLKQDYRKVLKRMNVPCPDAEWMMMGGLRDSENAVLDWEGTPEEDASGLTTPGELASWLRATGVYSSVKDEGNWALTKGTSHATGLPFKTGGDVLMLINAHTITSSGSGAKKSKSGLGSGFPNHFIVLRSGVTGGTTINFTYWTWGDPAVAISIPSTKFEANYYGAVIAAP